MKRQSIILAVAAIALLLATSAKVQAWGARHAGFTHVGYGGVQHYGATEFHGPGGSYGGAHYGSYGSGGSYHAGYSSESHYGGYSESGYHSYSGGYSGGYAAGGYHYGGSSYSAGVHRGY